LPVRQGDDPLDRGPILLAFGKHDRSRALGAAVSQ
jgi:hypothetical protein